MIAIPDSSVVMLIAVFLGVVLLVEGAYFYWRDVYSPQIRISKRMQVLTSGLSADAVQTTLRRSEASTRKSLSATILDPLERMLRNAGMQISSERFFMMMMAATLGIAVLFTAALGLASKLTSFSAFLMLLLFAGAIGIVLPLAFLSNKATKRIKKFEEQFPVALDIFVRGLRAGHPVTSALSLIVDEMAEPIGGEFAAVVSELNYGFDLRDALSNLSHRVQTPDIQMFVVSVAIQSETGGSLGDILEGLSRVIRDRASMVLKVRALASEGKMTAWVLSVLPLVTFTLVFMSQPNFFLDVVDDRWFLPGLLATLLLYTTGIIIIRRMIDLKI